MEECIGVRGGGKWRGGGRIRRGGEEKVKEKEIEFWGRRGGIWGRKVKEEESKGREWKRRGNF